MYNCNKCKRCDTNSKLMLMGNGGLAPFNIFCKGCFKEGPDGASGGEAVLLWNEENQPGERD